jgi:hypothetical protein
MALEAGAGVRAAGCRGQIAGLCAAMVSRWVFQGLLRLLCLLLGFVELVQILSRRVSLHAPDDMMALGLVVGGALMASFGW